jgi:hypothetical protein
MFKVKVNFVKDELIIGGEFKTSKPEEVLTTLRDPVQILDPVEIQELEKFAAEDEDLSGCAPWERRNVYLNSVVITKDGTETLRFLGRDEFYISPEAKQTLRRWGFKIGEKMARFEIL